ncbi:MAG: hypothetical protein AABY01_04435, partial [Nanoarchaeota archaeon]
MILFSDTHDGSVASIALYNIDLEIATYNLFENNTINTSNYECGDGVYSIYGGGPTTQLNNFTNNRMYPGKILLQNTGMHVIENNTINGSVDIFHYFIISGNNISFNKIIRNNLQNGFISIATDGSSAAAATGNSIEHNRINTTGYGIILGNAAGFTNVTNNSIVSSLIGLSISGTAANTSFLNNNFSTNGTAISMTGSGNNTNFTNNILSNASVWISASAGNLVNFTNTTFENRFGSIRFPLRLPFNGSRTVNNANLNITLNRTRLNATNLTWLNSSAFITLNGITATSPNPVVDFADLGTYINCPAEVCTEIDYVSDVYRFNVSHWTSYAAREVSSKIGLVLLTPTTNMNITQFGWFNVSVNVSCAYAACGEINVTLDPAVTTVYNFTNCGIAGRTGPSQANCDSAYTGTTLDGLVDVGGGIQNWTVPETGAYTIVAFGAKGGLGLTFVGGNGSKMNGTFNLIAGDKLKILVGQQGGDLAANKAGGGGGGTFVVYTNNSPLIIAGGGSGGGGNGAPGNGQAGTINRSGTTGSSGVYVGGNGGNGGTASLGSAGGGGLNGSGNTSTCTGTSPGIAFGLGGTGGSRATCQATGDGGFGGGSGGDWCCQGATGAGGGYSGGGGTDSSGVAGAGGSLVGQA